MPHDLPDIELPPDGELLNFTHLSNPPESSAVPHISAGVATKQHPRVHRFDVLPDFEEAALNGSHAQDLWIEFGEHAKGVPSRVID
ncbi:hypothetical protein [Streptomyces sp. NPDC101234]|uniref:hypothetical protein n=1 Tax=Streptomyces sp. NPDC101234 TaxID=3366138 RepID=UPI00381ADD44